MDRYPYYKYTILLGATRALAHIGIHFTHRVIGLSTALKALIDSVRRHGAEEFHGTSLEESKRVDYWLEKL